MRVGAISLSSQPLQWDRNTDAAWHRIQGCPNTDLILLPELFATGYIYSHSLATLAEPRDGTTIDWMKAASATFDTHIAGTFIESAKGETFNTFAIVSPKGDAFYYRKTAIPPLEHFYFSAGDDCPVLHTDLGRIGVLICWDITAPGLVEMMRDKIDMLVIPMAWADTTRGNIRLPFLGRLANYPIATPRRLAEELNVPVIACNMGGQFESRIPKTLVTYRAPYVPSTAVILPDSPQSPFHPHNNETLLVDLDDGVPVASLQPTSASLDGVEVA